LKRVPPILHRHDLRSFPLFVSRCSKKKPTKSKDAITRCRAKLSPGRSYARKKKNMLDVGSWARKLEPDLYGHSGYVAEWWNTISNILFVAIGVLRYREAIANKTWAQKRAPKGYVLPRLWLLFAAAGVCSAFHHSQRMRWTIIVDWIPIAASAILLVLGHRYLLHRVSWAAWFGLAFALAVLTTDHVCTILPPPWGHMLWHVSAAFSIAQAYRDMEHCYVDLFYGAPIGTVSNKEAAH
jgi:hypothetical protein